MHIEYGTVLKARPNHPIYAMGGTGIAFVTSNAQNTTAYTFMWINGDPTSPFNGDIGAIKQIDTWFEVIPDDQKYRYLPDGFVAPPDPQNDPMVAFMAMFK